LKRLVFRKATQWSIWGCGTGLNFSLLQQQIDPHGKIIGVALTDAVRAQAKHRVLAYGWLHIELVKIDAALCCEQGALIDCECRKNARIGQPSVKRSARG
jgi:hypothetical protein